jgi:excisionase family DNA binding protein
MAAPKRRGRPAGDVEARLLRIDDAAAALSVSRRTVEYMLADGRLEWVRVNGPTSRRLIPTASLDAYVESLRTTQAPPRKAVARPRTRARKATGGGGA